MTEYDVYFALSDNIKKYRKALQKYKAFKVTAKAVSVHNRYSLCSRNRSNSFVLCYDVLN